MPKPRVRLTPLAALFLFVGFLAWGVSLRVRKGPLEDGQRLLGFQAADSIAAADTIPAAEAPPCIITGEVGRGFTMSEVLDREGVPAEHAQELIVQLASLTDMRSIRPDDEYRLFTARSGEVTRFEFQPDISRYFVVEKDTAGLKAWREDEPIEYVQEKIEGTVRGSLYASMVKDGVQPQNVATFCDIFSYDVDFATETRDGDQYAFLIEVPKKEGRTVGAGRILGGRYRNGGKTVEAVWFEKNGKGSFYHPNGQTLRRAFLKSPLNYTRISSHFTHRRRHPIFKTVRPHLGVDYAAPTGTPVVSIGNGIVTYAGWINGYGKTVKVKHSNGMSTWYAHLSRYAKNTRKGKRVDQNQVIGYVGQTGHATGPHLDFRIEKGGRFIDPLKFKSTAGEPLAAKDRPAFEEALAAWRSRMDSVNLAENTRGL
jgi:murein DD-endopeptidase MepM/ murein hydrolase activator NlpD